jgi:hypothetical protein
MRVFGKTRTASSAPSRTSDGQLPIGVRAGHGESGHRAAEDLAGSDAGDDHAARRAGARRRHAQ